MSRASFGKSTVLLLACLLLLLLLGMVSVRGVKSIQVNINSVEVARNSIPKFDKVFTNPTDVCAVPDGFVTKKDCEGRGCYLPGVSQFYTGDWVGAQELLKDAQVIPLSDYWAGWAMWCNGESQVAYSTWRGSGDLVAGYFRNYAERWRIQSRFEAALNWGKLAYQANQTSDKTMVLMGQIYQDMGDPNNAHPWFVEAIEANPNSGAALYGAAYSEYELGLQSIAESHILGALRLYPNNYLNRYIYGSILLSMKRWTESKTQFQKAIELNPSFGWSYYGLGTSLIELGLLDEAKSVVLQTPQVLKDRNGVRYLMTLYANALAKIPDKVGEAINFYEYALQYAPDDPGILKSLMSLYLGQNECYKVDEIYGRLIEVEKRLGNNQPESKPTCGGN